MDFKIAHGILHRVYFIYADRFSLSGLYISKQWYWGADFQNRRNICNDPIFCSLLEVCYLNPLVIFTIGPSLPDSYIIKRVSKASLNNQYSKISTSAYSFL